MTPGGSTDHADPHGPSGSMDTIMVTGGGSDPEHLCSLWWPNGPWTSTETLAVVGPQTQAWSLAAARAQMSPWPGTLRF